MVLSRWPAGGVRDTSGPKSAQGQRWALQQAPSKFTAATALPEFSVYFSCSNSKSQVHLSSQNVHPPPPSSTAFAWCFNSEVLEAETVQLLKTTFWGRGCPWVLLGSDMLSLAHRIFKTK